MTAPSVKPSHFTSLYISSLNTIFPCSFICEQNGGVAYVGKWRESFYPSPFTFLTFSFSRFCLSIFFFHFCSLSDVHSFPPYCTLPQNFNIQNLKHYFIFLSFYFIPFITPFDGSYMKVPFYLRLFSRKFDSCVIW